MAFGPPTGGRTLLSVMKPDGSRRRVVAGDGLGPSWSPDGRRIAFSSARTGYGIWVVNADATGLTNLTPKGPGAVAGPAWSPDGKRIAFYSNSDGAWKLYTMSAAGEDVRPAVSIDLRSPLGPTDWGPRP